MGKQEIDLLAQVRKTHLGRHLFELNKAYKKVSLEFIQSHGFPEMTAGYLYVLSQIDLRDGTDMQAVVERVGASKQAVSRTIMTCEELGYIERLSSASDRRSLVICFKPKGLKLMSVAAQAIAAAEDAFASKLGKTKFELLKSKLEEASAVLDLIKVDKV
jgi:DNA-binding MarR family transcriptional regulator